MYAEKLHTRQYSKTQSGKLALRASAAFATFGVAAWFGGGIAHADNNYERQACALMDDHATAIAKGYSSYPAQYALAVLSTEMPADQAGPTILAATHDDCPNHAVDLPSDWR